MTAPVEFLVGTEGFGLTNVERVNFKFIPKSLVPVLKLVAI